MRSRFIYCLFLLVASGLLLVAGWSQSSLPEVEAAGVQAATTIYLPLAFTPPSPQYFGVAHDMVGEDPANLDRLIADMQAAGVQSVRIPFRWTILEPQAGRFEWKRHDRVVRKLRAANINIVGIFGSVPTWANGKSVANVPIGHDPTAYPPTRLSSFTNMIQQVVRHYGGDVYTWVIFNEPNIEKFWRPEPNVTEYVAHLCAGYAAIKQVRPETIVIGGALAGNGATIGRTRDLRDFLPAMYEEGARPCFDVLAIHPYLHPRLKTLADLQESVDTTRAMMMERGDFRPIWINEIGWSTAPNTWGLPTVTERQVATWLSSVYSNLHGVERIYWYNFRDVALDPNEPEFHFGLIRHDFSQKPAYRAFQQLSDQ